MAEVNYSAVNTEEAHHSTANNEELYYSAANNEEVYYSAVNSEELYYSAVNSEELYYTNAKELNTIEMRRNDAGEMPPQHSFQINMEENPAYVVGRPGTVT